MVYVINGNQKEKDQKQLMNKKLDEVNYKTEAYIKNKEFQPYFELLEKSRLAKYKTLTTADFFALGFKMEQYKAYEKNWIEEVGSAVELGKLPLVALSLITVQFAESMGPFLWQTQPMEDESGRLYYLTARAKTARGNVSLNDKILNPQGAPDSIPIGFMDSKQAAETVFSTASGTKAYTWDEITNPPIRPNSVRVNTTIGSTAFSGRDYPREDNSGVGDIFGSGFVGTITYATGAGTLTFVTDPLGTYAVSLTYEHDIEESGNLPEVQDELISIPVDAETFGFQTTLGIIKSFQFKKRFGLSSDEAMVKRLANEANAMLAFRAINDMYANYQDTATYDLTGDGSTASFSDKIRTLAFTLSDADSKLNKKAGRGGISTYAVSNDLRPYIESLRMFEAVTDVPNTQGPQLIGKYQGKPVIVCQQLPNKEGLGIYNGDMFDTAYIEGEYMPFMMLETIPVANNLMKKKGGIAAMKAMKNVNPNFVVRFRVI
jgi:hypothetical protein